MLCGDGLGEEGALAADALVDRLGEVLQEEFLLVRLHVGTLHTPVTTRQWLDLLYGFW